MVVGEALMTGEIFVPAVVANVRAIDPGEVSVVEIALPSEYEIEGVKYPIRDRMSPGTAFLAKPYGVRKKKPQRRMYTRSNCALHSEGVIETVINHTREMKSDTSIWWQSEEARGLPKSRGTIDLLVGFNQNRTELVLYENSVRCETNNLLLEPEWPSMEFVALAFSTGITPFLSYLCYMKSSNFGCSDHHPGVRFSLIASARTPAQLIKHEELLELSRMFPFNFKYYPVLTREWPDSWPYTKGRITRVKGIRNGEEVVDIQPLLDVVPHIRNVHLRMCGGGSALEQLRLGLRQSGQTPLSFRSEVW